MENKDFKAGKAANWAMISNCSKDIYEPHIDGFEVTGDLQIKRNKTKEISNKQFSSTVKQDPWKDEQLMMTRSIRSYKSLHGILFKFIS